MAQKIRQTHLPSQLPIIMITAKNQVADLVQGLDTGANDYLAKPFSKREFLARLRTHLNLQQINLATQRFVPNAFIRTLGKTAIHEVQLGDSIYQEMTILFSDIRSYTTLAEQMTPDENFRFVNAYASRMGPIIQQHQGFVNQFLGDGIMAIFQHGAQDALQAAIGMQHELEAYNQVRHAKGRIPLQVGMGFHTGPLIMGIIGDAQRNDAATISDAVNTAARMESLTKQMGANILLSEQSKNQLQTPEAFHLRYLGRVQVKGRQQFIGVYECFDADEASLRAGKAQTQALFAEAVKRYVHQDFAQAADLFRKVLAACPDDRVASHLLEQAQLGTPQSKPQEQGEIG